MKHIYKAVAITMVFGLLISAQGVEAQPHKNKQPKHTTSHSKKGENHKQSRAHDGYVGRDVVVKYHGHKGHHYKSHRIYRGYGHPVKYGHMMAHNGRIYKMYNGLFFATSYGRWIPVAAPIGMRVRQLPHGAVAIRTRHGGYYEFRGTFYTEARSGIGFVVVNRPVGNTRGHRGGW